MFWGEIVSSDRAVQKNVWLSSWVLSVSLLGDALLYIVLPINADAFGISIATVGFLLAVNRVIRTFTYNLVVNFCQAVGPKRLTIIATCAAVVSTFGYAIFEGVFYQNARGCARCVRRRVLNENRYTHRPPITRRSRAGPSSALTTSRPTVILCSVTIDVTKSAKK